MSLIAGKYRALSQLGEGGYGKVLLVEHADLGARFALKILNRALSDDEHFIERFKREAEILLRFTHPGSAQLRDFGRTEDGLYYMAMDYCEGSQLSALVERDGRFNSHQAIEILQQLLEVLDVAHSLNIIHRDIKPANIMVSFDDAGEIRVRVLDFGIARLRERALEDATTKEGMTVGTPQYMSPEQAAGENDLDHRVDLYSVGIVAYELLTGKLPFLGASVVQTLLMQITQPAPHFAPDLGISYLLEGVVMRALMKDREQRFSDAREFKQALKNALAGINEDGLPEQAEEAGIELPDVETVEENSDEFGLGSKLPQSARKTRILCLDDNRMILHIMQHILKKDGFEPYVTTNVASLHHFLFEAGVRLLISDVQMPGLSGGKVCQMLKGSLKDLKIVLFSSLPDRELEKISKESNADSWISKNDKPEDWLVKIREVLGEQH